LTPAIRAIRKSLSRFLDLSLPLLVARILADHAHHPAAPDDLAVAAQLLDRCL